MKKQDRNTIFYYWLKRYCRGIDENSFLPVEVMARKSSLSHCGECFRHDLIKNYATDLIGKMNNLFCFHNFTFYLIISKCISLTDLIALSEKKSEAAKILKRPPSSLSLVFITINSCWSLRLKSSEYETAHL